MNKGDVGLAFNTHWAGLKVASKESKGPVRLPCNVFDFQVKVAEYRVQRNYIHCVLLYYGFLGRWSLNFTLVIIKSAFSITWLVQATSLSRSRCRQSTSSLLLTIERCAIGKKTNVKWSIPFLKWHVCYHFPSAEGRPAIHSKSKQNLCRNGPITTLTVPLSIKLYKWVPANVMLGVTLLWTRT